MIGTAFDDQFQGRAQLLHLLAQLLGLGSRGIRASRPLVLLLGIRVDLGENRL